jgi:predicted amidohydrolase
LAWDEVIFDCDCEGDGNSEVVFQFSGKWQNLGVWRFVMNRMKKITVSLGQMDVKIGDVDRNLATMRGVTAEAARRGSDLILFPELWSTGYDLGSAGEYATPSNRGLFSVVASIAREERIAIVGSILSLLGEGRYGNTAVYWDDRGNNLGEYSKIHLFRLMNEEQYLTAGDQLTLFEVPWAKLGLAICYDLRFPELFRRYALRGAGAVLLPAEWPDPRRAHWLTLLQARAIENQMFLIACNRVGRTGDTSFFGHSCIVDPWGEFVLLADEEEGVWTAEIDLALVPAVRKRIPVFDDRRPDVYGLE